MNQREELFYQKNNEEVSRLMCKIVLYMTLVFPVLFILSYTGIFSVTIPALIKITPIGVFCTVSPTVLRKFHVGTKFLSYYSIIAIAIVIAIMASNSHIGIYITYILAVALSSLYFNLKFTRFTCVVGYICMVGAVFVRSRNVVIYNGDTSNKWFIAYTLGFTIEYIALSFVFIALAKRSRKVLENLYSTGLVGDILKQCEFASVKLSHLLEELQSSINVTTENNERIGSAAEITCSDCENNLLAINASIEAASAGEHGKGFAVVAQQVGNLAVESKNATQSINTLIEEIVQNIKDTNESVDKNEVSVAMGIDDISTAKTEALHLLELQESSKEKIVQIEDGCANTEKHQKNVEDMSIQISELMQRSLEQVTDIVDAIKQQINMTENMAQAFNKVQIISDDLLTTSKKSDVE